MIAHRVAYETWVGPIPDGLTIDHLCRNRLCIEPTHLEPVTNRENIQRGGNSLKTHCPQGHPYDEVNTASRNNRRYCRTCERVRCRNNWRMRNWGTTQPSSGPSVR